MSGPLSFSIDESDKEDSINPAAKPSTVAFQRPNREGSRKSSIFSAGAASPKKQSPVAHVEIQTNQDEIQEELEWETAQLNKGFRSTGASVSYEQRQLAQSLQDSLSTTLPSTYPPRPLDVILSEQRSVLVNLNDQLVNLQISMSHYADIEQQIGISQAASTAAEEKARFFSELYEGLSTGLFSHDQVLQAWSSRYPGSLPNSG